MKKTLSLMLALAMVFALVLVAAPAAEAATPCDHTNHEGWTEWNKDSSPIVLVADATGLTEGKYVLTSDIELDRCRIEAGHKVTICLNGYTINSNPMQTATSGIDLVEAPNGQQTVLNICDCSANKTGTINRTTIAVKGRNGCLFYVRENCELNLYAGTYKCALENAGTKPSLIYTMRDTTYVNIYEDAKFESANGDTVWVNRGVLNVYGVGTNITAKAAAPADGNPGGKVYVNNELKADQNDASVSITAFKTPTSTPSNPSSPSTGDSANLVVMGLGLVLGVAGMACLLPKKQTV